MFEQSIYRQRKDPSRPHHRVGFVFSIGRCNRSGAVAAPRRPANRREQEIHHLGAAVAQERPGPDKKQTQVRSSSPPALRLVDLKLAAPRHVPTTLEAGTLPDVPVISGPSSSTGTYIGEIGGVVGDVLASVVPTPVRPTPLRKQSPSAIRLSSKVSQSQLIYGPKPTYPKLALSARVEGTVRLQATISRDGAIENLHVLSGHPLLSGPAMQAVREWRYRPLLLNGDPVEVITEIEVNFRLSN